MSVQNSPSISICTPTYNRARYLNRVFHSLQNQNFTAFEWIVVDDGSVDDTENVVKAIAASADFPVIYVQQLNAGKHIAVNRALDLARGELFLVLDSDDRCADGALMRFHQEWKNISDHHGDVAGISVLDMFDNGMIVGTPFPDERMVEFLPEYYARNNISGDKWDIHQTSILRLYRFPETPGEKFCPEGLIWNRIAKKYRMLFINVPLKIIEYLDDGISSNILLARARSPVNTMMYYEEVFESKIKLFSRVKSAINYFRFSLHGQRFSHALGRHPLWGTIVAPLALIMWRADIRKFRQAQAS